VSSGDVLRRGMSGAAAAVLIRAAASSAPYGWERELEDEPRAVDLKWMDVMKYRITIRSD
jgi:hypothetical protein